MQKFLKENDIRFRITQFRSQSRHHQALQQNTECGVIARIKMLHATSMFCRTLRLYNNYTRHLSMQPAVVQEKMRIS